MIEQCFSAKKKDKGKAKELEPLTAMDEQLTHLLQWLHKARVPEDIDADVLNNPVRDEACTDLFCLALGKEKWVATTPDPLEAKKACTEPSVFVKRSLTQRAPIMPYNNMVPASNNQKIDKHPDFKMALSSAGPSKLVAAKVKLPKLVATKERMSKPSTKKAGTGQSSAIVTEADNSMVIATPIAFLTNIPLESEAGMIKVLRSRTYVMPGALPQEFGPPVQRDPHDEKFFVT
ncbi:hypothetical protein E4T56_gene20812 [Termitomyces sp. T112]|nr:hypothetical protein E4T56_gene20812 [Termitomyces sp. T112]